MFPAAAPATAAKRHSTADIQKAAPLQSAAFFRASRQSANSIYPRDRSLPGDLKSKRAHDGFMNSDCALKHFINQSWRTFIARDIRVQRIHIAG